MKTITNIASHITIAVPENSTSEVEPKAFRPPLVAYSVALELVRQVRPLIEQIGRHDAHVADQLRRASSRVVLNLAEGMGREAGNKRRSYEQANGEATEVLGCFDLALACGWALDDEGARQTLDRLLRLCHGLVHGRRERRA